MYVVVVVPELKVIEILGVIAKRLGAPWAE
jgi:hypothetical protein